MSAEWPEGILMEASSLQQDAACLPLADIPVCWAQDPTLSLEIKHSIMKC